jgi:hypothetical protein
MNRWRLLFAGITLGTLCACAAQPGGTTPATIPSTAKTPAVTKSSSVQITNLPCAEVNSNEPVSIRYPAETIYRNGAALPKEEGLVCLNLLSDWLKSVPQSRWQVTVAGEEGHGFDPLALAGKRQELLQRFFARKGLESKGWEWQTVVGQGEQLHLLELKGSP